MYNKTKLFVFILFLMVTAACQQDEMEIEPVIPEVQITQFDGQTVLNFQSPELFEKRVNWMMNRDEGDIIAWTQALGFTSNLQRISEFEVEYLKLSGQLVENPESGIEDEISGVVNDYSNIIESMNDGIPTYKYNNRFMSGLVNLDGLIIVGGHLLKYTDKEILNIPFSEESKVSDFERPTKGLENFSIDDGEPLEAEVFASSFVQVSATWPWEYRLFQWQATLTASKTFIPIYEEVTELECLEGSTNPKDCFVVTTLNIIGYQLQNTRGEMHFYAKRKKSDSFIHNWHQLTLEYSIEILINGRPEFLKPYGYHNQTHWTKDYGAMTSGSLTMNIQTDGTQGLATSASKTVVVPN